MTSAARRSARATFAERVIFAGLLFLLALAPLPFGADRPWAWSLLSGWVGLLLLGWGFLAAQSRTYQAASIRPILPAVGLFVLVLLWIAAQASGLAPAELRHPLWGAAASALGAPVAGTVSPDAHRTWTALMRLMCYGGIFLLTFQLCMSTDRSARLIRMLIVMTLIYACYGLFVQSAGLDRVLWYAKTQGAGDLSSTFLDRDAFAAYAGLGLMCALALLFRPSMRKGDLGRSWRFAARAVGDYFFARSWTVMLGACVLAGAIAMTHSRAGLAVTLLGAGVYVAVMAWMRGRPAVALTSILVIGVASASLFAIAGEATADRADRAAMASLDHAVAIVAAAPVQGVGYGVAAPALGGFRGDDAAPGPAAGGLLATVVELGFPAAAALALAVGWIVLVCVSSVRRHRRAAFLPCLGLGATVVAAAHGALGDSFAIPAVAATYAAILGAACAQSFRLEIPERRSGERRAG